MSVCTVSNTKQSTPTIENTVEKVINGLYRTPKTKTKQKLNEQIKIKTEQNKKKKKKDENEKEIIPWKLQLVTRKREQKQNLLK